MRTLIAVMLVGCSLVVAYGLSPLWVAMDVRRAVLAGDVTVLDARVDWPRVRQGLKDSLADLERQKQEAAAAQGVRPSLWTRIKAAASPSRFADQMIDRYVTPEGVVRMAAARGSINAIIGRGDATEQDDLTIPDHAQPFAERAHRFWQRLKRVTFKSATVLEIEVADRRVPARSYVGIVQFDDLRWRLTNVRVMGVGF